MLLGGLPLTLFYSIDAALLATNLSSLFRKMAQWQGLTLIATVLCAAPFGLNITCLALAIRSWIAMPALAIIFGRSCNIPIYRVLLSSLHPLIGATCMAALVSLPLLHPAWLNRGIDVVLLVAVGILFYIAYLYCFARAQLAECMADVFSSTPHKRRTLPASRENEK